METIDLKKLRKDLNLTQKKLAEVLDVQQPFLSRIENGLDPIPGTFSEKIKERLHILNLEEYMMSSSRSTYRRLRSDVNFEKQVVPIYEMEATAGIADIFLNNQNVNPSDHLMIPNLPKADGALFARGDSMYPLVKNGDLVVYKMVNRLPELLIWGEMYILYFNFDGEEMLTIKFVQQGSTPDSIMLVSQNQHHMPKEYNLKDLKAAALVKAVINYRAMI
ncbi:MAG: helix-turn-helix transcriptional regulator [Mangrovibacterium sp.]